MATREQWLHAFTNAARPYFIIANAPIPEIVRIGVGFPSKGLRSNVLGECWSFDQTEDNVCEIFIRPSLQSDIHAVSSTLTHELVHAALGAAEGHGRIFAKTCKALGMEGKPKQAGDGAGWRLWADPIIDALGPFPGSSLNGKTIGKKTQTTRMIKLECEGCGWACRTTGNHIRALGEGNCPTGCGDYLQVA